MRPFWTSTFSRAVLVDVVTEIEIERPRKEVARYATDPDNARAWYKNIRSVEWKTPPPLEVGSRIAFVAGFLGRRLAYTYEVSALTPDERLVMSTTDGPFTMETAYMWTEAANGRTKMSLRNRGEPARFPRLGASLLARMIRRANQEDLRRLKQLLERP